MQNATYYLDSQAGDDANDGLTPGTAWRTLEKASAREYRAGDTLLLARGQVFSGKLTLRARGTEERPATVGAWGPGGAAAPVIDARGWTAGVHVIDSQNLSIADLEITADAGDIQEQEARLKRYGVWIEAGEGQRCEGIRLAGLSIHDIFASEHSPSDGKNASSNMGMGVFSIASGGGRIAQLEIAGCAIARTGHTGIKINCANLDPEQYTDGVRILDCHLKDIGGPGIQPGRARNVLVRGNTVDGSGSSVDKRMHMRGSGIWPWTCENVLIEKNRFMHARGKADSCGVHIDFNCKDVVVQYNLSWDNEGGFIEILGNNRNCSYRYNISIDDGARAKGQNGAQQDGKVLWLSSFCGRNAPRVGPFNSYIYNNTIYAREGFRSAFAIAPTSEGVFIANNIFCLLGETVNAQDDQDNRRGPADARVSNVVFENNLFAREGLLPPNLPIQDSAPAIGDPRFKNPGGASPEDYIPGNAEAVKDRGIAIAPLPGDPVGLKIGLEAKVDFFGNPIVGAPDMGAIEMP